MRVSIKSPACTAAIVAFALTASAPARATGLGNPGFESGTLGGWTQTGNTNNTGVTNITPHTGSYDAIFGNTGSNTSISQPITFTPGTTLTIGGYLAAENTSSNGNVTNLFQILFDGAPIFSTTLAADQPYTFESGSAVATASDTVTYVFRNDLGIFRFDDASASPAVAISEPDTAMLLGSLLLTALAFRSRSRKQVGAS